MTRYRKSWTQVLEEVREVKEAVVVETDYKYDGKVVKISKKNFSKVHKDYKNSTKGKETMLINDPKTNGTISVPVQFEETELDESAGLQLKMAFDDAGIKIKGVKGGKLVVSKKDKKEVEKIIAKQMKKPADAKRVLGSQIVFEEIEMDEKFAGWIAFYNKEKLEIKPKKGEIDSLNDAKQAAIKHFKVPKSKQGLLAIEPAHEEVELAEKGTAYPATIDTLRMIVKDKQHQTVMFKSGKAIVDLFTASAMVQVYDALKKPEMKKHFEKMIGDKAGFMKTQAFAMKMIG